LRILFITKGLCKIFSMAQIAIIENNLKSPKYLTLGLVKHSNDQGPKRPRVFQKFLCERIWCWAFWEYSSYHGRRLDSWQ
jgi:hypothetical protein